MNVSDEIARLLGLAEPLRALDDDDPAKGPLTGMVDEINRLRVLDAVGAVGAAVQALGAAQAVEHEAQFQAVADEVNTPTKRGPGRPRKVAE